MTPNRILSLSLRRLGSFNALLAYFPQLSTITTWRILKNSPCQFPWTKQAFETRWEFLRWETSQTSSQCLPTKPWEPHTNILISQDVWQNIPLASLLERLHPQWSLHAVYSRWCPPLHPAFVFPSRKFDTNLITDTWQRHYKAQF